MRLPGRASCCALPCAVNINNRLFAALYAAMHSPYETDELREHMVRMVHLRPPLATLAEVWGRTDTGIGGSSPGTPYLRIAGTHLWLPADTHLPVTF